MSQFKTFQKKTRLLAGKKAKSGLKLFPQASVQRLPDGLF
jgi:hypothetical protein